MVFHRYTIGGYLIIKLLSSFLFSMAIMSFMCFLCVSLSCSYFFSKFVIKPSRSVTVSSEPVFWAAPIISRVPESSMLLVLMINCWISGSLYVSLRDYGHETELSPLLCSG